MSRRITTPKCLTKPSKSRNHLNLQRKTLITIWTLAVLALFSSPAFGQVERVVHFEWAYDSTVPNLAGYILYQDGVQVSEVTDPAEQSMDLDLVLNEGTNTFTISAVDIDGHESLQSEPYYLDVPPEAPASNQLPLADIAVSSTAGTAPLTITLDASGSSDPDGTIVEYNWSFGDGQQGVGETVNYTYIDPGSYTVVLSLTDDSDGVSSATRVITVDAPPLPVNEAPSASISASATSGPAPLAVSFDGSRSSDPDGTIVKYGWNFGDGGTATGRSVTHTFGVGVYLVTLTVTDDSGATAKASRTISAANQVPTARISATPASGAAPLLVAFDGTASSDPDGSIASYSWNFGDGGTATGGTTLHTFKSGTYTVTLTVKDNYGATAQTTKTITATNQAPTAVIADDVTSGTAPLAVVFDGNSSSDPDGSIANYTWNFGDGLQAVGKTVNHTFLGPGVYTVTLKVTDDRGAVSSATTQITVDQQSTATLTGDFDGDGDIDRRDARILRNDFGRTGCGTTTTCATDLNGDGTVDWLDYQVFTSLAGNLNYWGGGRHHH